MRFRARRSGARWAAPSTVAPTSFSSRLNSGDSMMIVPPAARRRSTASGSQHERRRLQVQVVELLLVLQRRERYVDGVDLGGRDAQGRGHLGILVGGKRGRIADHAHRRPARRGVLQRLDRLVGERVDRRARRLEQDVDRARGRMYDSSQLVGGDDSEFTTKTMILLRVVEGRRQAGLVQRFEDFQRIEHAAHARRCPTRRRRRDGDRAGGRCRHRLARS